MNCDGSWLILGSIGDCSVASTDSSTEVRGRDTGIAAKELTAAAAAAIAACELFSSCNGEGSGTDAEDDGAIAAKDCVAACGDDISVMVVPEGIAVSLDATVAGTTLGDVDCPAARADSGARLAATAVAY